MRGILGISGYVPYRRLDRSAIGEFLGTARGSGTRSVASFDEDTTTMAVEACRFALQAVEAAPGAVWFATAEPAYLEKTNATTIHAALRLDTDVPALDMNGAVRCGIGALRVALESSGTTLVAAAGIRTGLPGSLDESSGGDGAAAVLVGDDTAGTVIAEYLAGATANEEFVDRWKLPGWPAARRWEERFGEVEYGPLAERAWNDALKGAHLTPDQVDVAVVTGVHDRAARSVAGRLGAGRVADDLSRTVGNTGAAHAGLLLASVLEEAQPGQVVAVVHLADGADVLVFRTTDALARFAPHRPVATQIAGGAPISYAKFLAWHDMLEPQGPNRPAPGRTSAAAAARNRDWKFGFVGSRDRSTGLLHLPPSRASVKGGGIDEMDPAPMADVAATIRTYTVDRLAYSPSPPIVFAVLDFDGGGRYPCELTDVEVEDVEIGQRVEMTFRRLGTADGIHNYFWKARPIRA